MYRRISYAATTALLLLAVDTTGIAAQVDTDSLREALRAQVSAERQSNERAAQVFLDGRRSDSERLAAVREVRVFLAPDDLLRANRIALSANQSVPIRVRAVQLAGHLAAHDADVLRGVLAGMQDRSTPVEVRRALGLVVASLMFGSATLHEMMPDLTAALRAATADPDTLVASRAFSLLAAQGDTATLQAIARGLETRRLPASLDAATAVGLLGLTDPEPWFPVLRGVLRNPPDSRARLEAIRLLGRDRASQQSLIGIFRSSREPLEMRFAALGALAAGLTDLAAAVLPVVDDEASPAQLRVTAIRAVEQQRVTRDQAIRVRSLDSFDVAVERLAQRSADAEVRAAAARFVQRTRSPH